MSLCGKWTGPKDMVCSGCGTNEFLLSRSEATKIITGWKEDKKALGEGWDEILNFCTNCGGWGDIGTWITMSVRFDMMGQSQASGNYIDDQIDIGFKMIAGRKRRSNAQRIARAAKKEHRENWFKNGGTGAYLMDRFAKGEITWAEYRRRERQDYTVAKIPIQREHLKQELAKMRQQIEGNLEWIREEAREDSQ